MFRGDYGFLSSMGAPKYIYRHDPPRTETAIDRIGKAIPTFHKGVVFRFTAFQGGHLDVEQRFVPDHVPAPTLRGTNLQKPGHAAGFLCVTSESERTGVPEEDIIRYFTEDPSMKNCLGRDYILVDKSGNPTEYGKKAEVLPSNPDEGKALGIDEPWLQMVGEDRYFCELCQKGGAWKGRVGHLRSKVHQKNRAEAAVAA